MRRLATVLIALLASACAGSRDDLPEIVVDRSACSHCGMLISELRFASAYRAGDGEAKLFDEIGCMVAAARQETSEAMKFWFRDADDGGWIEGGGAVFVSSPSIRTPMGGGVLAFRTGAAADAAASRYAGRVVRSLPELMALKGGPR